MDITAQYVTENSKRQRQGATIRKKPIAGARKPYMGEESSNALCVKVDTRPNGT